LSATGLSRRSSDCSCGRVTSFSVCTCPHPT
jgi:hypothetical protein